MNICKTKTLRTNQLFVQDNYKTLIQNIRNRFERLTVIAKKKHPNTFSYTPWVHRAAAQQSQMSQQYQAQLSQKQAQYESFMSRFQASAVMPAQQLSTTVTNAANAVAVACKQAASGAIVAQLDNTIGYKSPKYLADLKILKERQAKLPPPPPPPPTQTQPTQAQPVAALPQQVVVNSAQVVGGTVVVVDSSQPVVQVLLTSQYSSSMTFSYLTRSIF